jgi:hypothetical protein
MTDIIFKPYLSQSGPGLFCYGVEAHWRSKAARRRVFVHNRGKSHCRVFCSFTRKSHAERMAAAQHLAEVLNLWITEHNEEELNELILLIETGTTANLTAAENELVAHYLLNGGEPF